MIGTRLKNRWLSQYIAFNPGVSDEDLTAFESRYRISLPSDLRDYFLTVNGMAEDNTDSALIRFWPLNEIQPITENAPAFADPAYIQEAQSLFVFADYSIWVHAYAIKLSRNDSALNPIFMIGGESPVLLFNSFSDLVSEYLIDPERLV